MNRNHNKAKIDSGSNNVSLLLSFEVKLQNSFKNYYNPSSNQQFLFQPLQHWSPKETQLSIKKIPPFFQCQSIEEPTSPDPKPNTATEEEDRILQRKSWISLNPEETSLSPAVDWIPKIATETSGMGPWKSPKITPKQHNGNARERRIRRGEKRDERNIKKKGKKSTTKYISREKTAE